MNEEALMKIVRAERKQEREHILKYIEEFITGFEESYDRQKEEANKTEKLSIMERSLLNQAIKSEKEGMIKVKLFIQTLYSR